MPRLPRLNRRLWDGYTAFALITFVVFLYFQLRNRVIFPCFPWFEPSSPYADSIVPLWRRPDSLFVNYDSPHHIRLFGFTHSEAAWIIFFRDRGWTYENVQQLDSMIPQIDHDHLALVASCISFRPRQYRVRPRPTYPDAPSFAPRSPRIPLFLADSLQLTLAGLSPTAWDTLATYQRNFILAGSLPIDSLVNCSPAELALRLKAHVRATRHVAAPSLRDSVPQSPTPDPVNLNSATPEQLSSLPGIGEKTAQRIIEFRRSLGGFVSPDQLEGLWPITPDNFQRMRPYLTVDSQSVAKINVNSSNDTKMRRHPYFPPLLVSRIWQLKMQNPRKRLTREDVEHCAEGIELNPFFWHYVTYEKTR